MACGTLAAGAAASPAVAVEAAKASPARFRYGLNMSTIRGQGLDAAGEIDVAIEAGYDAIEPWLGKLREHVERGGKLADLRKRIEDGGLTVESAIGFAPWIVDDEAKRAEGFEEAKRDMDVIAQLGGTRIAAAPAGAPRDRGIDPMRIAERYRQLLELGDEMGVVPQIEMWGGNKSIGRVSTAVFIAMESGHPKACFLGDVYHTYKGGSAFEALLQLGPQALQTFHMNDYPADPPRETIRDEHRVYPGDGIAPLDEILQGFRRVGANPVLNLELFNRSYWQKPAIEVARTGLAKMKAAVAKAGV
ncbi:sugar phosphate isomerase/epimerase [Haloferula rosea]|uniref:Sugar phosphate isomerase/epimerase n=2 Tax=Haloferula rosea TaxID=490093 RepID=A0A934VCR3_9BACT|nr:sugar phosphate isomerase/epimerase [Haloferula rosea]